MYKPIYFICNCRYFLPKYLPTEMSFRAGKGDRSHKLALVSIPLSIPTLYHHIVTVCSTCVPFLYWTPSVCMCCRFICCLKTDNDRYCFFFITYTVLMSHKKIKHFYIPFVKSPYWKLTENSYICNIDWKKGNF